MSDRKKVIRINDGINKSTTAQSQFLESYRTELSYWSDPLSSSSVKSSIGDYAITCNSTHHIHTDNFNILATSRNLTDLRMLESLLIHKEKPSLNNMLSAFPLQ